MYLSELGVYIVKIDLLESHNRKGLNMGSVFVPGSTSSDKTWSRCRCTGQGRIHGAWSSYW